MTCPVCGRYGRPDPETGYDGDDICPSCARLGWTQDADGTVTRDDVIGQTRRVEAVQLADARAFGPDDDETGHPF